MKEIQLTRGMVAFVDDDDFDHLNQWKWFASNQNGKFYAGRNTTYVRGVKRSRILMHRVILELEGDVKCDHRDGNGLNNQKSNLRQCTSSQNNANKNSKVGSTSKYVGVSIWKRLSGKTCWKAQISNKKVIHIGLFEDEKDAALAYNQKASEIHGEFAHLNIIEP